MPSQKLNTGLIYTNNNCIGCNKCISGCNITGANVVVKEKNSDRYKVVVNPEKCVLCGYCIKECLHNARTYKDDTDEFFNALKRGEKISVIVATSLLSDYEKQYHNILGYLKSLGVNHIYNAGFGADIMIWGYINLIKNYGLNGVISQLCPVIINYLEKYKPELLKYLLPVQSPMMCTAIYVNDYLGITDRIAYISPCIAAKHEINDPNTYRKVSYNVTFDRLMKKLDEIDLSTYNADDEITFGLGALISMAGGLSDNIELYVGFHEVLIEIAGPENILPYFKHYYEEALSNGELPFLADVLSCTNSCNFGTGTNCGAQNHNKVAFSAHRAREYAYKSGNVPTEANYTERVASLNKRFENLHLSSFLRQYDLTRKIQNVCISDETLNEIYRSMYKYTNEQRNTDCGSCGHKTCKDMAFAIALNVNIRENCINYAKECIRLETVKTDALLSEISAMNEELKDAAQLKSNFLANMSHEIRTPMNAVIGMAEMALRGNLPDEERSYIRQIKSSGRSLLAIINDILDFTKIESGKMELSNNKYTVMSVINDTINIIMARIGEKDIKLIVEADPDTPFMLYGDDIRTKQVLVNIAHNAVKFTESGYVCISMSYKPSGKGVFLNFSINDSGIGIKPEDMKRLFNSFEQVDSKRNRNLEGTGLGLAISKEFITLMGGEIHVESIYGQGSTFSFTIYQEVVDSTKSVSLNSKNTVFTASCIQNEYVLKGFLNGILKFDVKNTQCFSLTDIDNAVKAGAEFIFIDYPVWNEEMRIYAKSLQTAQFVVIVDPTKDIVLQSYVRKLNQPVYSLSIASVLNNEKDRIFEDDARTEAFHFEAPTADILIVDDNAINLTVVKGLLSPMHMNIVCASSAKEAIGLLETTKFDIVFMDHMMPEIDGVEATHMIRDMQGEYFKNLPIIALTANSVNNAKQMYIQEGMNDFVAKPIEMIDITAKLKKWLPPEKVKTLTHNEVTPPIKEDIPEILGLDVKTGLLLAGNLDFYKKILSDYYAVIEDKANAIEKNIADLNIKGYTIEVHSLKSASKIIGANELADMAAKLEKCGNDNDIDTIENETPRLLCLYRSYITILEPYYISDEVEATQDITNTELIENLSTLYQYLDDFDIDSARDIVKELQSIRFDAEAAEILEKLRVAVKNLDYENGMEIANMWKELL